MEQKVLEMLERMEKTMHEGFVEVRNDIKRVEEKLDTLTNQTRSAVVTTNANQIHFLKDKVNTLEEAVFHLKKNIK